MNTFRWWVREDTVTLRMYVTTNPWTYGKDSVMDVVDKLRGYRGRFFDVPWTITRSDSKVIELRIVERSPKSTMKLSRIKSEPIVIP